MRNGIIATLFVACYLAPAGAALAQRNPGGWDIAVTPRFWYMLVNSNSFSESTTVQKSFTTAKIPLYGASISVRPPGFELTDFLITGFYGTTEVEGKAVFSAGASADSRTEAARTDIELLVRNRIPDSGVLWFFGLRWVFLAEDSEIEPGFTFSASNSNRLEEETNFYLAEFGLSFSTPFRDSKNHSLFANLTTGLGYETRKATNRTTASDPDDEGYFPFFDMNVGYEYRLPLQASAHVRYRAFILREIVRDEFLVLHGPEIGFTLRF